MTPAEFKSWLIYSLNIWLVEFKQIWVTEDETIWELFTIVQGIVKQLWRNIRYYGEILRNIGALQRIMWQIFIYICSGSTGAASIQKHEERTWSLCWRLAIRPGRLGKTWMDIPFDNTDSNLLKSFRINSNRFQSLWF